MSNTPKDFPITPEQVDNIVKIFYAKIRVHPVLGEIFNGVIGDINEPANIWDIHEEKICRFWRTILLKERSYSGNPTIAHIDVPGIKSDHFPMWLDLFETVLQDELPEEAAAAFSARAQQIGKGLRESVKALNG